MSSYDFTDVTKNKTDKNDEPIKRLIVGTAYNLLNLDDSESEGRHKMGKAAAEVMNKISLDETYQLTEEDREILYHDDFVRLHFADVDPEKLCGIPIFVEHDKNKEVGKIKKGWIEGKNLSIVAEIWNKEAIKAVDSGNLPSLSVGYGVSTDSSKKNIVEVSLCKTPFFKGCHIVVAASKENYLSKNGEFFIRCMKTDREDDENLAERIKKKSSLNEKSFFLTKGKKYHHHHPSNDVMSKEQDHPAGSISNGKDNYFSGRQEQQEGAVAEVPLVDLNNYIATSKKMKDERDKALVEKDALAKEKETIAKEKEEMAKQLKSYQADYTRRQKAEYQKVAMALESFEAPEVQAGGEEGGEETGISEDTKKSLEKMFYDTKSSGEATAIAKMAKKLLELQKANKELIAKQEQQSQSGSEQQQQPPEEEQREEEEEHREVREEEPEPDPRREQRGRAQERPTPTPTTASSSGVKKPVNSKSNVTDVYKSSVRSRAAPTPQKPAQAPKTSSGVDRKRNHSVAFSMERTPEVAIQAHRKEARIVDDDMDAATREFTNCIKILANTPRYDIGAVNSAGKIPHQADNALLGRRRRDD